MVAMVRSTLLLLLVLQACNIADARSMECSVQEAGCLQDATNATSPEPAQGFRFWVDYHAFRNGATALYEEALQALGGQNAVNMEEDEHEEDGEPEDEDDDDEEEEGGASQDNSNYGSANGFDNIGSWDVYISNARNFMAVFKKLRPGQLICYQAGSAAVAAKSRLVSTLQAYYGHAVAGEIVPVSFKLPGEVSKWQEWIQQHTDQDTGVWLLKNDNHRGQGVRLVPTSEAVQASRASAPNGQQTWKLAQQYIANPLLLDGRKFGIRLHVFIPPGPDPFRVYVHKQGFANLSELKYDKNISTTMPSQASGHFTNQIVQRELWESWQLDRLKKALGDGAFKLVWDRMTNSTAWIMAAALSSIRTTTKRLRMPARSAFEVFGIDFLVDDNMHVWVTEVNSGPSMRLPDDPDLHAVMKAVKVPAVRDMFGMMRLKERQWDEPQAPLVSLEEVEAELQLRGDWLPLMHLYPQHTQQGLRSIPWSESDKQLQAWLKDSPVYHQAIADWYP